MFVQLFTVNNLEKNIYREGYVSRTIAINRNSCEPKEMIKGGQEKNHLNLTGLLKIAAVRIEKPLHCFDKHQQPIQLIATQKV